MNWRAHFEKLSAVEAILREDPSGVYSSMDFQSRDFYRHSLEKIAARTGLSEVYIAKMSIQCAKEAEEIALRDHIFLADGEKEKDTSKTKSSNLSLTLYRSKGCQKCDNSGYLGRMGIYEVLEMDDEIGKMIIAHESTDVIQQAAVKNGMITMQQDGFLKTLEGITTVEEVLRVTRE
jgi:type II secretory ATPase GspE/PulE/Tfp pilus assembly ATPase PilB-like protein